MTAKRSEGGGVLLFDYDKYTECHCSFHLTSFQAQFKLCYEAVASVLRSFNEYSNFTDLE